MTRPESHPEPAPESYAGSAPEADPEPLPDTVASSLPEASAEPEASAVSMEMGAAEPPAGSGSSSSHSSGDNPGGAAGETAAAAGTATTDAPAAGAPVAAEPAGEGRLPIYRDFNLLQLAAIVFLLDQLTKFLVRAYLPFGHSFPFDGFVRFTHIHNTGSAFGILQGQNTPLIFVSVIGILVLALIYRSQPRPTNLLRLSLGLQIGGALGNLLDRLRLGWVTDFIDVGAWPVFNLADASIVTGLVLLAWLLLRPSGRHTAPDTNTGAGPDNEPNTRPETGLPVGCPENCGVVESGPMPDDSLSPGRGEGYAGTASPGCPGSKDGPR